VRRQIHERDDASAPLGHFDVGREILHYRIVELHFAAPHHVGEHERREHLRNGADLENGVAVERPRIVFRERAVRDDATVPRIDESHDDSNALMLFVDPLDENRPNDRVRREQRWATPAVAVAVITMIER
jgi:hypothetical protein